MSESANQYTNQSKGLLQMQICNSPFVFGGVKKENNYAGEGTLK